LIKDSLHSQVGNARLFLGQLANHNDKQGDDYHADHRPKSHSSARPSIHPSICMIHVIHVLLLSFFSFVRGWRPADDVDGMPFLNGHTWLDHAANRTRDHQFFVRANNAHSDASVIRGNHRCILGVPSLGYFDTEEIKSFTDVR
jgi:hypothetical protein